MDYKFDVLDIRTSESDLFVITLNIIMRVMMLFYFLNAVLYPQGIFIHVCDLLLNKEYD